MLRTLHDISSTIVRAAKQHPGIAIGLGGVGVLLLVTLARRDSGALQLPGSSPAGGLPSGPLPKGTTSLTSYLPDAFFVGIHAMGERFRSRGATITDEDIIAILMAESGLHANIPNRVNGVCVGLNQICPKLDAAHDPGRTSGLRAVGFQGTLAEYSALSETAQLPFVQAYFDNVGNAKALRSVGSLYLANFSPAFLGNPDDFVMYRPEGITHGKTFFGPKYYNDNASVDSNPRKGFITVGDMSKFAIAAVSGKNAAKWNELRMRLRNANGGAAIAGMSTEDIRGVLISCAPGMTG